MQSLIRKLAKVFPHSLIAEIVSIFGDEQTEKFISVFGGTNIKIPSSKELREMEIALAVYDTLSKAKSRAESRRLREKLCDRFSLNRREVRMMYKHTRRMMGTAKKVIEADRRTASFQKPKMRVQHKSKRRY